MQSTSITRTEYTLQVLTRLGDGKKYLGIDIYRDYKQKEVHVSMLNYVPEALVCFQLT